MLDRPSLSSSLASGCTPLLAIAVFLTATAAPAQVQPAAAPATTPSPAATPTPTLATPAVPPPPGNPSGFFFHDGDRVQICGDSITEQRMYSTLVESYVLSRYPAWKIQFRNTGWSGDGMAMWTRNGVENGFARDIAPLNPTAITIDYGMNDARAGDSDLYLYVSSARQLEAHLRAIGCRVAYITPSCEEKYETFAPGGSGYNLELEKFADRLKMVAADHGSVFVDQLHPMEALIDAGRKAGVLATAEGGARLVPDNVHPNWGGHLIMATTILKGLGATPLVSTVTLDAQTGDLQAEGAQVTGLKLGRTLTFTRLDSALPWPIPDDPNVDLALKLPGFTPLDDLSRYTLTVKDLFHGDYTVAIDGTPVGTYSDADLAAGLNLSRNAGPVSAQAQDLLAKILAKNELYFQRWRKVQLFDAPDWLPKDQVQAAQTAEVARLDGLISAAEAGIDTARQPVPHVWTITPVAPPPGQAPPPGTRPQAPPVKELPTRPAFPEGRFGRDPYRE